MLFLVFILSGGYDWLTRKVGQLKGAGGIFFAIFVPLAPYLVPASVGIVISAWFQSTVSDNGYAYCLQTRRYSPNQIYCWYTTIRNLFLIATRSLNGHQIQVIENLAIAQR
jgi:hypothetical protein